MKRRIHKELRARKCRITFGRALMVIMIIATMPTVDSWDSGTISSTTAQIALITEMVLMYAGAFIGEAIEL